VKQDIVQNFIFKDRAVRGSFVRLHDSYQTIVDQHHYPPVLSQILGEALLGVCLVAPLFKNAGKVTIQFQGDGDLQLLSTRITSDFAIRGLVRATPHLVSLLNLKEALASGELSLTYEPDEGKPYQSFIKVEKTSIAETLQDYFDRSEQLPTRFFLASTDEGVAGLMLQMLPDDHKEVAYQDFEHAIILAKTLENEELLSLDPETILHRLFSEDDITLFPEREVEFGCNCSQSRMGGIIVNLGREQADSILEEHGFIEITCEYCGQAYQFNSDEVKMLFAGGLGFAVQPQTQPHLDG